MMRIIYRLSQHICLFFLLTALLTLVTSCKEKCRVITPSLLIEGEAMRGGSIIWEPNKKLLYWLDSEGKTLHEYNPKTEGRQKWVFTSRISALALESEQTLILALEDELVRFNLENENLDILARLEESKGELSFSDGKCGPEGNLWIGTTSLENRQGATSLYSLSPDGKFERILRGMTFSNGITWSPGDKFMYYNDTPTRRIQRYRYYKHTGDILFDGNAVKIKKDIGLPYGMTIDSKGNLWVAQWGGFGVYCYNPYTGELLAKVELPVPNVASCAFGGENMETLYITTARLGLTEEELAKYPLSGSVFSCQVGSRGMKPNYFGHDNRN